MTPHSLASAWQSIQIGLHLLMAFLLGIVVLGALDAGQPERAAILTTSAVLAAVYLVGLLPQVRRVRPYALLWLGALVAAWLVLMVLTPEGVWLAFPLFFLTAHLLGDRLAVPAVAALTVAAVLGFGWHQHVLSAGTVIGPSLGALVALGTVLGLRAVDRESTRRGVLEERERLAQEIHDTLTQGLSSIHLLLGAADGVLTSDPTAAAAHIERAREVARDNLDEARRFVRALSPSDLADASLPAALRRLVDKTTHGDGPVMTFEVSGDPSTVPTAYDVALLRIAQAGVSNALVHSGAGRVALTLSYMGPEIALDIVDDGRGFDPATLSTPADGHGFGLPAMRARTEQLGGRFTVESSPESGTAVAVTFPLGAETGR
ncbi:MAG TPA: sensor histidine kinase [Nocardioidaceae bacterium]|nr:sensor histidine kinase [Nocardioidaceae bacterium]